ncbi:head-tail connector protein [Desulfosporosinus lacus]|nr:head-tail connector protein [Desulfosporosinus lacus]
MTPPAAEPVSLPVARAHLRLDTNDDDAYVNSLIIAAREYCETYQNRAYITQTWEMALPSFPLRTITIPKGRLQTIEQIFYKNAAGIVTTLIPEIDYVVSHRGILGRVCPPFGKAFPYEHLYPLDPVVVRFMCGYGDTSETVPARVKQAMLLLIGHWYENRMAVSELRTGEISFAVAALLSQEKIVMV